MCNFFSCISDGNGNVSHFTMADVVEIMAQGNPKGYDFNSHTSYMDFAGIKGRHEDRVNKWEYDPLTKKLTDDNLGAECDDRVLVQAYLDTYFEKRNAAYINNIFNRNSGNWNSGNECSGAFNTKPTRAMFNTVCTEDEYQKTRALDMAWFALLRWIPLDEMTDQEKADHPECTTSNGYLRERSYQEAWADCPHNVRVAIKKLPHFDAEIFEEITGLKLEE